jgi:hypothetical protein
MLQLIKKENTSSRHDKSASQNSSQHGMLSVNYGNAKYDGNSGLRKEGTRTKMDMIHTRYNRTIRCGSLPENTSEQRHSIPPLILSSLPLAQMKGNTFELRIHSMCIKTRHHLKIQSSRNPRSRKVVAWITQVNPNLILFINFIRRESLAPNAARYRSRAGHLSQGTQRLRRETQDKERALPQNSSHLRYQSATVYQPGQVRYNADAGRMERDEEMVDENFHTTQQLAMRLDSHSATLNFTLETLSSHRAMISQLQDEVEYLRSQGERLEKDKENRAQDVEGQSSSIAGEAGGTRAAPVLPDLNVALEPPAEEIPQSPTEGQKK